IVSLLDCLSFYFYGHHRDLHSFPTRRSSDLYWILLFDDVIHDPDVRHVDGHDANYDERYEFIANEIQSARNSDEQYIAASIGCRSEEHTSELQSRENLVCRLLLEKKKKKKY